MLRSPLVHISGTWRVRMEDYEAQEQEFWRKLAETDMSRSQMLKRSVAAAAGLTVLSSSGCSRWPRRRRGGETPPLKGRSISIKELVAEAKKEGKLNVDRAAARLGELRRDASRPSRRSTASRSTRRNPDGSSAQENQAIVSLKGDSRAPDVVDVRSRVRRRRRRAGAVRRSTSSRSSRRFRAR